MRSTTRIGTTARLRRRMPGAALVLVAAAAATLVTSTVSTAAPDDCAWQKTAQRLFDSLRGNTDDPSLGLRAAAQTALDSAPACAAGTLGGTVGGVVGPAARPYFAKADWLWNPIPADAVLDPRSAAMGKALASGDHIADTGQFGVTLVGPDEVTSATPRRPVSFSQNWGSDPFGGTTMPMPAGIEIPPGSDGHVSIADPVSGYVYSLWQAKAGDGGWSAGWGAMSPLDGDGRETDGSSTGAGLSRFAGVIRADEIARGLIPHALFFSSDMVTPQEVRYPAAKTDGSNDSGESVTVPEGARVQLDPSVDLGSLDLTPAERTIATALQTYGAYVGDNGGARMAFIFEYAPGSTAFSDAGLEGDFAQLSGIPWAELRVLKAWDGGATDGSGSGGGTSTGTDRGRSTRTGTAAETSTGAPGDQAEGAPGDGG